MVTRADEAQAQAIGTEVLACTIKHMYEGWVDCIAEIEGEYGGKWNEIRDRRVGENGHGVDFVGDEVQLVSPAEQGEFFQGLRGLVLEISI